MPTQKKKKKKKRKASPKRPSLESLGDELPCGHTAKEDLRQRKRKAKTAAKAIIRKHITPRTILEGLASDAEEKTQSVLTLLNLRAKFHLTGLKKVAMHCNRHRVIKKEVARIVGDRRLSRILLERGWENDHTSVKEEANRDYVATIVYRAAGPESDSYSDYDSESS